MPIRQNTSDTNSNLIEIISIKKTAWDNVAHYADVTKCLKCKRLKVKLIDKVKLGHE